MKSRASIFEDVPEVDVSAFVPKGEADAKAPIPEQVRAVSETANFRSREVPRQSAKAPKKRQARVYRTGRNVQFNVKASQETVDAFYSVTEANPGWVLRYTLERAIEALKRELAKE